MGLSLIKDLVLCKSPGNSSAGLFCTCPLRSASREGAEGEGRGSKQLTLQRAWVLGTCSSGFYLITCREEWYVDLQVTKFIFESSLHWLTCPWRFCWKTSFEASGAVFWSLSCYKELKLTSEWQSHLQVIHFVAFRSRCKVLVCEVWACTESKILR